MKKIVVYLGLFIFCFAYSMMNCFASSASITSNNKTITKGNSVKITVTVKTDYPMVSVEGTLKCSGVASTTQNLNYDDSSNSVKVKTYSYTLKPTSSGTITCNLQGARVTHLGSSSWESLAANKLTITVNDPPVVVAKPKSSNNYLSSITIDGYELDSKFEKETLEYSVTVKEGTEKIKINAQLADSSAKVNGTGEVSVSEGLNTFSLEVTAENGSKRTYVVKVTVKEFEPIEVKVDKDEYTVVRKRKGLPEISEYFVEKDITIGEEVVEGYYSEQLKYQVVGLKDKTGSIKYYIYDNGEYSLYNEQVFNGMVLRVLDKEIDGGYKKTSFSYNDTKIDSYQEVKLDILKNTYALDNNDISGNNFYLFYAVNLETGREELYQYDSVEKTVQRYNTLVLDMYKERSDKYYLYLLCSILVLGVTIVTFSTIIICGHKKRKKIKNSKNRNKSKKIDDFVE